MNAVIDGYTVKPETFLKTYILTHGIIFSDNALLFASENNAKGQNLVYNMPLGASNDRPQELMIKNNNDGYETVVSCVSPTCNETAVFLDVLNGDLAATVNGCLVTGITISFVKEPHYYRLMLKSGIPVKRYITSCGFDEFNILPWKGCAISQMCKFCGANSFVDKSCLNAVLLSKHPEIWNQNKYLYLSELEEAAKIAINDDCFREHMHVILIAGNLSDELLDFESEIFADISQKIYPIVKEKSSEGIVLVITPPRNKALLHKLKNSGISKVVFNLEAISPEGFSEHCPGKKKIGYDFFMERLIDSVSIWGKGSVWTNLVLGLESNETTLPLCRELADMGVVVSANVLHIDKGNRLTCAPPAPDKVIDFYFKLEKINAGRGLIPFYCSKALRTSLSNEAHNHRIAITKG